MNDVNIQFLKLRFSRNKHTQAVQKLLPVRPMNITEVQLFNLAVIDHRARFSLGPGQTCSNITCQNLSKLCSGLSSARFREHTKHEVAKRPWGGGKGISVVSTTLSCIFIFHPSVMDFLGLKRVILLFVSFLWSSHMLQSGFKDLEMFFWRNYKEN